MKTKLSSHRWRWPAVLSIVLVLAVLVVCAACNTQGFDPQSKVDSVRLFAITSDKPYAKPGDTVTFQALYTDSRQVKPHAAKLYWIPVLCLNPDQDLYYLCFANPGDASNQSGSTRLIPLGALADAGAGADAGASGGSPFQNIPTGVDLAPFLPQGNTFSFRMPDDAIEARNGTDAYGLAVVFEVLCAGRIEFAARDPNGAPQQVPVLCADENGVSLSPSDYVIGISRVYAYADRTNANPTIEKLTLAGNDVDPAAGITIDHCTTAKQKDCPENKIGIFVPDTSWEVNPSDVTPNGTMHEQIWVEYYSDLGVFDDDARLLFDTQAGRSTDSDVTFRAPKAATDGTLWAVVHDNRGGASWSVIPLHVR